MQEIIALSNFKEEIATQALKRKNNMSGSITYMCYIYIRWLYNSEQQLQFIESKKRPKGVK